MMKAPSEPTFSNYRDEQVIISGADLLSGWKEKEKGVYAAPMPWTMSDGNQIFADGKMLSEACWPNAGEEHLFKPQRAVASGGSKNTLTCETIPGAQDVWKGAQLWCAGGSAWICWTVTGLNPETKYQLSAWMRASDQDETAVLGVKDAGTEEVSVSLSAKEWTRRSIDLPVIANSFA